MLSVNGPGRRRRCPDEARVIRCGVRVRGRIPAPRVDHKIQSSGSAGPAREGGVRGGKVSPYPRPHADERPVRRALHRAPCAEFDLRIAGFRNTFENWQAPPEARYRHVRDSVAPPGVRRAEALSFDGEPSALEAAAGVRRAGLHLGRRPMVNAVIRLHRNSDPRCTAHALLVLTEMICEAGRSPSWRKRCRASG